MKKNLLRVLGFVLAALWVSGGLHAQDRPGEKVLRYAFEVAETGFDPAQISDVYSRIATASIFDSLYDYDYLARPVKVRPRVAEGMPVIDDPISMIRCTNKVYLWERLIGAGLPAPETMIIQDKTDLEEVADRLQFPVVLKIPDGSFSIGIRKASSMQELREIVAALTI